MASDAKLRANKKYLESRDETKIRMPQGKLKAVREHAKRVYDLSFNAYINKLIDEDLLKS